MGDPMLTLEETASPMVLSCLRRKNCLVVRCKFVEAFFTSLLLICVNYGGWCFYLQAAAPLLLRARLLTSAFPPRPQLLDHVTFIDTPGVLSGEKQRTMRSYDFTGVVQWFAQRSDLILLLFDPHKLDISDEFKRVIGALRGQDDKIRVVLNKADQVETQQVGALKLGHS